MNGPLLAAAAIAAVLLRRRSSPNNVPMTKSDVVWVIVICACVLGTSVWVAYLLVMG